MQSLWTSLNGLKASSSWLDTVGNNIANSETPGYASSSLSFEDMLTAAQAPSATLPGVANRDTPLGWRGGTGVRPVTIESNFSQMPMEQTGNSMDFAIQGSAFFMVQGPAGASQPMLTKAGDFQWSNLGNGHFQLSNAAGQGVLDVNGKPIVVAASHTGKLSMGPQGRLTIDGKPGPTVALADVTLPSETLTPGPNNTYTTQASNVRIANGGAGGQAGLDSTVVQGALLKSNVDMTQALTQLIQAQHMFDLNSEALDFTDKMIGMATTIRA